MNGRFPGLVSPDSSSHSGSARSHDGASLSTIEFSGAVIVDKPRGWTSHDVVNKIRRILGTRRIGHLGTLDPNATGVLPLLIGRATRLAQFFGRADKRYEGVVRFGYSTDTWDVDGTPLGDPVPAAIAREDIETALTQFRGPLQQVPPPVSAKKVGGIPAYKLARRNQPVQLPPVKVEIFAIEATAWSPNSVTLRIHCSAGTYVRSIAHELGQKFTCGAHLESLRRIGSGMFDLSMARTLDELSELSQQDRLIEALLPAAELLPQFPVEQVDDRTQALIRQGRAFRTSPFRGLAETRYVKAIGPSGDLIAIGEIRLPNLYHPVLVL